MVLVVLRHRCRSKTQSSCYSAARRTENTSPRRYTNFCRWSRESRKQFRCGRSARSIWRTLRSYRPRWVKNTVATVCQL